MKRRDESRKTVRKNFRYIECDAFAEYLRDMSLQGWHFCGWTSGLVFEKGEPEDVCYCVEVFPKGSEMDTAPEPDAMDYAEYCRAAGWELIDGQRSFCIFRRIDEDAVPIVTEEERLENIFRAERKALLSELTSRSFLTLVFWREFLGNQFEDWAFSDARLLLLLFCTVMTVYRLCKIAALYVLRTRCRRKTSVGVPVYYGRRNAARRAESIAGVLALAGSAVYACIAEEWAVFPILAAMYLIFFGIDFYIGHIRPKRKENWGLQIGAGILSVLVLLVIAAAVFSIPGAVPGQETDTDVQASDAPDLSLRPEDYRSLTENPFVLGGAPVPLFYGAACDDVNTVGGFANWVQDWEYTACPHCGKPMKYLAQIQWDTLMDGTEGTLYIEFCPDCQIVSMQHAFFIVRKEVA